MNALILFSHLISALLEVYLIITKSFQPLQINIFDERRNENRTLSKFYFKIFAMVNIADLEY